MCEALEVSASGYYAWASRPDSPTEQWRQELAGAIEEIHAEVKGRYGSPRMTAELKGRGYECSENTVAGLMRGQGIRARTPRRFVRTTDSRHGLPVAENVLDRDFDPPGPNVAWSADITYIPTASGWAYLAAIIDLGTRLIVGWSMATHMRTELVESALLNALTSREPASKLVHHSDRGSQYASASYRALLEQHGIECSMSRRGDCYDNAVIESFFGTFKQEWAHHHRWAGLADARAGTHDYIEVFYNRQRLHSALGYRTPTEVDEAA